MNPPSISSLPLLPFPSLPLLPFPSLPFLPFPSPPSLPFPSFPSPTLPPSLPPLAPSLPPSWQQQHLLNQHKFKSTQQVLLVKSLLTLLHLQVKPVALFNMQQVALHQQLFLQQTLFIQKLDKCIKLLLLSLVHKLVILRGTW
jgi:hypothetical protein